MSGKILITGGAGFIGTHLAERLCPKTKLALFDNLRRNSLSHIPELKEHRNVSFINGDVLDRKSIDKALEGVSAVVHLAAIAGVSSYYERPLETLRVNLLGTVNMLEACAAAGIRKFIYASTSEVFGPDALWVDERQYHKIGGVSDKRWVYATSKLASEQFVMRMGEANNMACTILRPFNVYGPRQTGEGAIANFCTAAIKGSALTVYGDGTPLRAWCYVSDFVDAAVACLTRAEAAGEDFNIGNPREVETTLGLARCVARLIPGTEIKFKEMARAEVRSRVPVIEKARRLLIFEPKVSLEQGLQLTLDWHRSRAQSVKA